MGRPKGQTPWNKGTKGLVKANKGSFQKGRNVQPWNKGKKMPKGFSEKISKILKERVLSKETRKKISLAHVGKKRPKFSIEWRRKMSESHLKIRHLVYNWKGGITPLNQQIRKSIEYKFWREAVFKRDNWICVLCGQKGGNLNADHIKSFALFPELRFAIDNGRTLCIDCHKKTDNYGRKNLK